MECEANSLDKKKEIKNSNYNKSLDNRKKNSFLQKIMELKLIHLVMFIIFILILFGFILHSIKRLFGFILYLIKLYNKNKTLSSLEINQENLIKQMLFNLTKIKQEKIKNTKKNNEFLITTSFFANDFYLFNANLMLTEDCYDELKPNNDFINICNSKNIYYHISHYKSYNKNSVSTELIRNHFEFKNIKIAISLNDDNSLLILSYNEFYQLLQKIQNELKSILESLKLISHRYIYNDSNQLEKIDCKQLSVCTDLMNIKNEINTNEPNIPFYLSIVICLKETKEETKVEEFINFLDNESYNSIIFTLILFTFIVWLIIYINRKNILIKEINEVNKKIEQFLNTSENVIFTKDIEENNSLNLIEKDYSDVFYISRFFFENDKEVQKYFDDLNKNDYIFNNKENDQVKENIIESVKQKFLSKMQIDILLNNKIYRLSYEKFKMLLKLKEELKDYEFISYIHAKNLNSSIRLERKTNFMTMCVSTNWITVKNSDNSKLIFGFYINFINDTIGLPYLVEDNQNHNII